MGGKPGKPAKVCGCGLPAQRSRGSAGENITPLHRRGSSQTTGRGAMPRRLASNPTILWCVSVMKELISGRSVACFDQNGSNKSEESNRIIFSSLCWICSVVQSSSFNTLKQVKSSPYNITLIIYYYFQPRIRSQ